MKNNKPRHNNENQKSKYCNKYGWIDNNGITRCRYFDGDGITSFDSECNYPWANRCKDGNIHNCIKLKYKYLASLSDKKKQEYAERFENK